MEEPRSSRQDAAAAASVRIFVAIELDHATQAALRRSLRAFDGTAALAAGRWVPPDRMHLTLQFLGATETGRLGAVAEAMGRACAASSPFSITFTGTGFFPEARKPHVAWLGVGGELDALTRLQASLQAELAGVGFAPDARGYHPHLTLARVRRSARSADRRDLVERVRALQIEARMRVHEVSLFRSDAGQEGSVYTCLAKASLRADADPVQNA
jgi:2'-5' RNA ligase